MANIVNTITLNDKASDTLQQLIKRVSKLEESFGGLEAKITKFPNLANILNVGLGGVLANLTTKALELSTSFIKMGFDFNKNMETYTTNFTTLLGGSVDAAMQKVEELQVFAAKTPFAMSDLAKGTQTLLAFGVQSEYTTDVLRMLGDVAMGNNQAFESLTRVFGQVSAQGKLTLEDVNQLIGVGFNPLSIMVEKTGKSMASLKESLSAGEISASMFVETLRDATSEGGLYFGGMESASKTLAGVMSTLADNVASTMGTLMKPLTDMFKGLVNGAIFVISVVQPIIQGFVDYLTERSSAIQLVLITLGVIATAFAIKWLIAWSIANITTIITVGVIIAKIVAVIAIIWSIIEVLNYFGIDVNKVLGFVGGVFSSTFAIINNIIYGTVQVFLMFYNSTYNTFVNIANFVSNVFKAPVTSVIKLFEGMATNVLNVLQKIAKGVDFVFGSNLSNTIEGWKTNIINAGSKLIDKYAKNENYAEKFKKANLTPESFGLELKNVGDAWNKGFEKGEKFLGNLGEKFKGVSGIAESVSGTGIGNEGNTIDKLINSMGGSGGNDLTDITKGLKGVNDKLSGKGSLKSVGETKIKDENLKYLSSISGFKFQENYQKTQPQININLSTGDINNGADEKRLIDKFSQVVMDALDSNLSGGGSY